MDEVREWCDNMSCVFKSWCETGDALERKYMSDFSSSMNALFPLLIDNNFKLFYCRVKK